MFNRSQRLYLQRQKNNNVIATWNGTDSNQNRLTDRDE